MTELELPPQAGGDQGIESFTVETPVGRAGRVAALNRTPEGLVLVVDDGSEYRALSAWALEQIDVVGRAVRLGEPGARALAASPVVSPAQPREEGARLVRYIPTELDRLVTTAGAARGPSPLWLVGIAAVLVAAALILPAHFLVEKNVAGSLKWLWFALPLGFLLVAAWAIGRAIDADRGERLPLREKFSTAWAFLLGVTPRRPQRR